MAFMANGNKEAFPVPYEAVQEIFCIFVLDLFKTFKD